MRSGKSAVLEVSYEKTFATHNVYNICFGVKTQFRIYLFFLVCKWKVRRKSDVDVQKMWGAQQGDGQRSEVIRKKIFKDLPHCLPVRGLGTNGGHLHWGCTEFYSTEYKGIKYAKNSTSRVVKGILNIARWWRHTKMLV